MEKIKEELEKAKQTFESLLSLQSQQKIYLIYDYDINLDKSEVENNFQIVGETNSELEKELFDKKIKDLNSYNINNNLKTIKEESFNETIKWTDLDDNPVSIKISGDKINIIYIFSLFIKENDKYFNNVIKFLEENKEKWKNKIRFIGIHFHKIDKNKLDWVFQKKIDFLEIYYLENGVMDYFPKHHGISHVPCIFMIDKEKKIKFKNYEKNLYFKFDTGIDNLIDGKKFELNIPNQTSDENLNKEKDKIFNNIYSLLDKIEDFKSENEGDVDKLISVQIKGCYIFHYDTREFEKDNNILFMKFLNLDSKESKYIRTLLEDFKIECEEEIDEINLYRNYETKGEILISGNKEEKCTICQNNFILNENNFYCCVICNLQKKIFIFVKTVTKIRKNVRKI